MEPTRQAALDHAWRYFESHATQRMALFNFFLVLAGLVAAGIATAVQASRALSFLGLSLGVLLTAVSFIFWKLDQRASALMKESEKAAAELELDLPECARIFRKELAMTDRTTT